MIHLLLPLAVAAPDAPHAPASHGTPAEASHGEGHDEGGHGGGHHTYTTDDDHDGVPNWRDRMNGAEPNEDTYVVSAVGFHAFNLLLLLGVAGWFLRKPVADTFRERALEIRHDLTDSARKRDEAHQRHQDLVARLSRIEDEVRGLEAEAATEAKREEEKLVERAHREAARIAEQAERNIRDEVTRARHELRTEAVELAVKLAEETLRKGVSHADRQALAREFLSSLSDPGGGRV